MAQVKVYPDSDALALAVATDIAVHARECISRTGRFSLCLSGGSTPRAYHAQLVRAELAGTVDWGRVSIYWGDERFVAADHADSNYRMARETLLSRVPIPADQVHRVETERGLQASAAHYELVLRNAFSGQDTAFDLVLLGMGDDGHTASLFPGSAALTDDTHWVAAVQHTVPPPPLVPRITLTPALINRATQVWFVVSGASKAPNVRQAIQSALPADQLPARAIQPRVGAPRWYVDDAAASLLDRSMGGHGA